ncbi:histidine-rich knob protein homolog KPRPC [Plasmodium malariae]|uniref:Histidine-rich knob protein homolog KPRPC n=1 Tax=Plasmodium malariae TaxID=5858 RepID=A0A1A8WXC2_PLAMA|nr:histidine-rich knob protein homolog KPRPC [Plasmodium malariae]
MEKCGDNCYNKYGLQKVFVSRTHRSLAVLKITTKKPYLKGRLIVKEKIYCGFKEYEENYEMKHYKLKENAEDGNKNCDEKYEATNYTFKEKCPYEIDICSGSPGPDIYELRKRFPIVGQEPYEDEVDYIVYNETYDLENGENIPTKKTTEYLNLQQNEKDSEPAPVPAIEKKYTQVPGQEKKDQEDNPPNVRKEKKKNRKNKKEQNSSKENYPNKTEDHDQNIY